MKVNHTDWTSFALLAMCALVFAALCLPMPMAHAQSMGWQISQDDTSTVCTDPVGDGQCHDKKAE